MKRFEVTQWDELSCEWRNRVVVCEDDPSAIDKATNPEDEGLFEVVFAHRIEQHGETGWFVQLSSDRGHLSCLMAIQIDLTE